MLKPGDQPRQCEDFSLLADPPAGNTRRLALFSTVRRSSIIRLGDWWAIHGSESKVDISNFPLAPRMREITTVFIAFFKQQFG
jgi:hypothetical protein